MKILFFVIYFLLMGATHAEVYKCKDKKGVTVYQDVKCPASSKMSKLDIKEFDKNKIERAQQKLARELEQRAAIEAAQAEAEREERAIQAIELRARADAARAYAADRQTLAIDRNTEAVRSKNKIGNVYYYNPRPIPKPYHPIHHKMKKQAPKIKAAGYK
jgi:uncharacterized protein DUF4124